MLDTIVTDPTWERQTPADFRVKGERYWTTAELPLAGNFLLLVGCKEFRAEAPWARTKWHLTTDPLMALDIIGRAGGASVVSAYLAFEADQAREPAAALLQVTSIDMVKADDAPEIQSLRFRLDDERCWLTNYAAAKSGLHQWTVMRTVFAFQP